MASIDYFYNKNFRTYTILCVCVFVSQDYFHCFLIHQFCFTCRNGVLIDHYLTEVNGQNVIGLKDKQIAEVFSESPRTVTITMMPKFVYDHLMKK